MFQIDDIREAPGVTVVAKTKPVRIGWKHRYAEFDDYLQQKAPVGGVIKLFLQPDKKVSIEEIVQLVEPKFTHPKARQHFKRCQRPIKVALNNGTVIETFSD